MLVHIKIDPSSSKREVIKKTDVSFVVKVKSKPERNEANIEMKAVLGEYLRIEPNKIKIITGHHSPSKIVDIME